MLLHNGLADSCSVCAAQKVQPHALSSASELPESPTHTHIEDSAMRCCKNETQTPVVFIEHLTLKGQWAQAT